jgi:hypothetical protein
MGTILASRSVPRPAVLSTEYNPPTHTHTVFRKLHEPRRFSNDPVPEYSRAASMPAHPLPQHQHQQQQQQQQQQ